MLDIQDGQPEKEAHNYAQRKRGGDRDAEKDYLQGYQDAIVAIFNYMGLKYGLLEHDKARADKTTNDKG